MKNSKFSSRGRSWFPMLALWALHACGGAQPSSDSALPTNAGSEQGSTTPATTTTITDMHGHFEEINAIQSALIAGNLVSTRELAKKIRLGFAGPAPEGWAPFIERSVASAEMLEVVDDLSMAARLAGTMANTCGDCHRAQNIVVVEHVAVPPPKEEDRLSNFMTQHRWAADRMWEGLIGPSNEAWNAGALALQDTELTPKDVEEVLILTPAIESLLVQVREDAVAAQSTTDPEERQVLYGRFLAACASCHQNMKDQLD